MAEGDQPASLREQQERQAEAEREITRSYKRCFATDSGRVVLEDLKRRFGFMRTEYFPGCTGEDLAFRVGQRQAPVYIDSQVNAVLRPIGEKKKKRTARSGLQ